MTPDSSTPTPETLVDSTAADLTRLLREFAGRLHEEHQQQLQGALAEARVEAERTRDLVVQETLAEARAESDEVRERLGRQQSVALAELETRLRGEAAAALDARALELRAQMQSEMRTAVDAAVSDAVTETERRVRAEADEAVARATREVEERLRSDADAALRLAQEAFEQRLAATVPSPGSAVPAPLLAPDQASAQESEERDARLEMLERVLRAVERLDAVPTLRAALDELADVAGREVPRALLFVVRGDRVRGWKASGVTSLPGEFSKVDLPLASVGPFQRAVESAAPVDVSVRSLGPDTGGALSWLEVDADAAGLVVPLSVDGQIVALLYADDAGEPAREVPGSWPESVQLLARHASRVLEVLTARRAAAARAAAPPSPAVPASVNQGMSLEEARRYARLVVSEVKLYNEHAVRLGREAHDLRTRLADPIARARRLYDERVPAMLPGREECFEQELQQTLAGGDPSMLGEFGESA